MDTEDTAPPLGGRMARGEKDERVAAAIQLGSIRSQRKKDASRHNLELARAKMAEIRRAGRKALGIQGER